VKIECLICLRETAIPKNINTANYDGQITCRECGSLLQVKLVKSKVERCKIERVGHPRLDPGGSTEAFAGQRGGGPLRRPFVSNPRLTGSCLKATS
jgi:hypothetical protein